MVKVNTVFFFEGVQPRAIMSYLLSFIFNIIDTNAHISKDGIWYGAHCNILVIFLKCIARKVYYGHLAQDDWIRVPGFSSKKAKACSILNRNEMLGILRMLASWHKLVSPGAYTNYSWQNPKWFNNLAKGTRIGSQKAGSPCSF